MDQNSRINRISFAPDESDTISGVQEYESLGNDSPALKNKMRKPVRTTSLMDTPKEAII